jgi:hypothetical protein
MRARLIRALGAFVMNTLSFRTTEDHGLSIELLIDGQSLVELVDLGDKESGDTLMPYYDFEGGLPLGYWGADDPSIKCIGVCVCGISGCGRAECRVVREGDVIVLRDFSGCVNPHMAEKKKEGKEFRVTSANYDSVIADIMKQVADYQART